MSITSTFKNPDIPILQDPINLDKEVQNIQIELGSISWLHKSFGRAKINTKTDLNGKKETVPLVYNGGKEYYPCNPNDAFYSYAFCLKEGPRKYLDYQSLSTQLLCECNASWIFWANLERCAKVIESNGGVIVDKDSLFTEHLIKDTLAVFSNIPELKILSVIDENPEQVFSGIKISNTHRDLLLYPYQSWRIKMKITYFEDCLAD